MHEVLHVCKHVTHDGSCDVIECIVGMFCFIINLMKSHRIGNSFFFFRRNAYTPSPLNENIGILILLQEGRYN